MESKRVYVEKMKTKLDEWDAEIDELIARAHRAKSRAEQEKIERVAALKTKALEARQRLDDIRDASGSAWQKLTSGAEQVWDDLKKTLRESQQAFREGKG